jgi:all-trans-8'-apo-beta-carotenal 15,15'-oxygenase
MDRRSFLSATVATTITTAALPLAGASLAEAQPKPLFANNPRSTPMRGFAGQDVACENLAIEGKIPQALRGVFYRNGPGLFERGGQRYQHWFDGDGLLNAWRFTDAGVSHQAKFIRTEKFIAESEANEFLMPSFGTAIKAKRAVKNSDSVNTANTNVVRLGSRLLAMWEGGSAYDLDPQTLATRGPVTWKPELKAMPFSAHPKVEADGTFWNFGTAGFGKIVLYHLSAAGEMLRYHLLDAPPCAMVHDFAVSQKHMIFLLAPVTMDRESLKAGSSFGESLRWNAKESVKVLVVEKSDFTKQRVMEMPAFMVFHFGNAWEMNNVIRVDFVKSDNLDIMSNYMPRLMRGESVTADVSNACFMKIDLNRGRCTIEERAEQVEFPRIDPRFVAQRNRLVFYPTYVGNDATSRFNSVLSVDTETGKTDQFSFGEGVQLEEHIIVPKPGSVREGEGWLMGVGFDANRQQSFATVFDALNLSAGPTAIARLPYWVPLCFHGNFYAA